MHYDKRFQKDPHFPLIAFNHEQMKESTTARYLTCWRGPFLAYTSPAVAPEMRSVEQRSQFGFWF